MPPQTPVSRLFEVPCESFGLSLGRRGRQHTLKLRITLHMQQLHRSTGHSELWDVQFQFSTSKSATNKTLPNRSVSFDGESVGSRFVPETWNSISNCCPQNVHLVWFLEMNKKKFPWISSVHEIIHIHLGHGNCGDAPRGDSDVSPRTTATSDSIGSTPSGDLFDLLVPTFQNSGCFFYFPSTKRGWLESRKPRIPSRSMNNFLRNSLPWMIWIISGKVPWNSWAFSANVTYFPRIFLDISSLSQGGTCIELDSW